VGIGLLWLATDVVMIFERPSKPKKFSPQSSHHMLCKIILSEIPYQ